MRKQIPSLIPLIAGALVACSGLPCFAQSIPTVMNYEGRLTDNSPQQNPINGTIPMEFRIYGSAMGADLLWSESWASVDVVDGIFSVLLGSNGSPINPGIFVNPPTTDRYLEFTANSEVLTPRQQIGSVGYAVNSESLGGTGQFGWQKRVVGSCGPEQSISSVDAQGLVLCEVDDVGITAETDPQVGPLATNVVPRWTGSALNSGILTDTGSRVGVGSTPNAALQVSSSVGDDLFRVQDSGSTKFFVADGGNVGVGAFFTPTAALEVHGTSLVPAFHVAGSSVDVTWPPGQVLEFATWDGTNAVRAIQFTQGTTGDAGGQIDMWRFDSGTSTNIRTIQLDAEDNGDGSLGGTIVLYDALGAQTLQLKGGAAGASSRVTTGVLEITGGSDLSEQFDIHDEATLIVPGTVVSIDPDRPGRLTVSRNAYDPKVAGIVSGAGGVETGVLMGQSGTPADGRHAVALSGRVYTLADASNSPIAPGDLLTSSELPGHAMRATDRDRSQGAIIGKAMSFLDEGTGLVLVLVNLQ